MNTERDDHKPRMLSRQRVRQFEREAWQKLGDRSVEWDGRTITGAEVRRDYVLMKCRLEIVREAEQAFKRTGSTAALARAILAVEELGRGPLSSNVLELDILRSQLCAVERDGAA